MHEFRPLCFESLLRDPLIRAVMRSDQVSERDMLAVLGAAQVAIAARERAIIRRTLARTAATNAPPQTPATRAH